MIETQASHVLWTFNTLIAYPKKKKNGLSTRNVILINTVLLLYTIMTTLICSQLNWRGSICSAMYLLGLFLYTLTHLNASHFTASLPLIIITKLIARFLLIKGSVWLCMCVWPRSGGMHHTLLWGIYFERGCQLLTPILSICKK